jgi:hypothetical protein
MRLALAFAGLAAFAIATTAAAQPALVAPISYSPEFQTALSRELGAREGAYLSNDLTRGVSDALARRGIATGANGLAVEISIVSADPNRPTMQQLFHRIGLDASSVSVGGAEFHALIKAADGRTLSEVTHREYDYSLADLVGPPATWTTAERAIDQLAEKVADAYEAQTHAQ